MPPELTPTGPLITPGMVTIDVTSLALTVLVTLWAITTIIQIVQAILLANVVKEQQRIARLVTEETLRLRFGAPMNDQPLPR